MSVSWSKEQLERVTSEIAAHPVDSGRCARLARELLPIARELDPRARGLVIRANTAQVRYPCFGPKVPETLWWFHRVTIEVQAHCVDALTGALGTLRANYIGAHFRNDSNELWIDERDPNLEDLCL